MTDQKPMNVLLIEDNAAETKLTCLGLAEARNCSFHVEVHERLEPALARLARGGVDIVLLDLNLPDSQGFETFERTLHSSNGTPIVIMSGMDDEGLAIRAVSMGAQDYVLKGELEDDSLVRTLLFAIGRHKRQIRDEPKTKGKLFAFVGAKGGVGTTTVALNVAAVIASSKKSVIALELRSDFGTFSGQLGHTPRRNLSDLLHLSEEEITETEINACLVNFAWGMKALFGPQRVEQFQEAGKEKLDVILNHLTRMADFVVVDLADGWSEVSRTAVSRCHLGAVVLENDPVSVIAGKMVLQEMKSSGASSSLLKAVVVNRSGATSGPRVTEIGERLDCGILGYVTPAAELCLRATEVSAPFCIVAPDAAPSVALKEMVSRLLAQSNPAQAEVRSETEAARGTSPSVATPPPIVSRPLPASGLTPVD